MKNLSYQNKNVKKLTVKGLLMDDGETIEYLDDEKSEQTISISKCFEAFIDKSIVVTIALNDDEDLTDEIVKGA